MTGSIAKVNIRQLTPEESRELEYVQKKRDLVLRELIDVDWARKLWILQEVVAAVIKRDVPQGGKQKARRLFNEQLERNLRRGTI